ncbi:MAG: hypothetical protein J7L26_12655 [Candidatus Aminicenantes bacterium]|nr:hypothetical protein [Candidatus Aminicenantes bacterium]
MNHQEEVKREIEQLRQEIDEIFERIKALDFFSSSEYVQDEICDLECELIEKFHLLRSLEKEL